jgi:hypothetical protein
MSIFLLRQLEEERHKLNQMGVQSLEQLIALSQNQAVQEQSRKVDELIIRYANTARRSPYEFSTLVFGDDSRSVGGGGGAD